MADTVLELVSRPMAPVMLQMPSSAMDSKMPKDLTSEQIAANKGTLDKAVAGARQVPTGRPAGSTSDAQQDAGRCVRGERVLSAGRSHRRCDRCCQWLASAVRDRYASLTRRLRKGVAKCCRKNNS